MPSTTGPAYLPFLTGRHPADHNITGIRWFDKDVFLSKGRWNRNAMRSYCGYEAKYFNDDMDPSMPSLFEEVERGFNIYNMITKGVKEEFDVTKKGKTGLYFKAHFYHKHHPVDHAGHERMMECLEKNPQFIFAVFPSIDWDSHTYHFRDEKTIEAYRIADRSLGELVDRLRSMGRYDDTLVIMASDHGLSSTQNHLDLGNFFSAEGYRVIEYPTILTFRPNLSVTISGNSFASICFLDRHDRYTSEKLLKEHGAAIDHLVKQEAIDFILLKSEKGTTIVKNRDGHALLQCDKAGLYHYHPESADPFGLEGDHEELSDEECYQETFNTDYPDSLHQVVRLMESHRAGDMVINARTGHDLRDFWEIPEHKGSHGSLHWEHMHVPILTNQPGLVNKPVRTTHLHEIMSSWLGIQRQ